MNGDTTLSSPLACFTTCRIPSACSKRSPRERMRISVLIYFDDSPLPEEDPRAQGLAKTRELREFKRRIFTLYRRGYAGAHANPHFAAGSMTIPVG